MSARTSDRSIGASLTGRLTAMWLTLLAYGEALLDIQIAPHGGTATGRAKQTATVIAVVTAGVAGLIGIFIFANVNDALPTINDSNLSSSKTSLVGGFGDAMELLPVVLIVLLAALVIGVVMRMKN